MEEALSLCGDAVRLVGSFSLLGGLVLVVEVLKGFQEATGNTMLMVEVERTLGSLVTDDITVGEIFGDNTRAGLLFLSNLVAVLFVMSIINFFGTLSASYGDLGLSKLSVVK